MAKLTSKTKSPNQHGDNKRYCYELPEGGVAVVTIAPKCPLSVDEILAKDVPNGAVAVEINKTNVPNTRRFRKAWVLKGKKIDVDLPKARDVVRDELRLSREEEFRKADVEFMAAMESNDDEKKVAVVARKQKLRDVTTHPAIEAADTADDLAELDLDVLLGK